MTERADLVWVALNLQAQSRALGALVAVLDAHVELLIDRLAERDGAADVVATVTSETCPHPEDVRMEAGSLRAPLRFFCKACRRFVNPAARIDPPS